MQIQLAPNGWILSFNCLQFIFSHFFFFFLLCPTLLPSQITLTCSLFSLFVVSSVLPACCSFSCVYFPAVDALFLAFYLFSCGVCKGKRGEREKWKIKCGKMIISLSLTTVFSYSLPSCALISLTLVTDCPHSFISSMFPEI